MLTVEAIQTEVRKEVRKVETQVRKVETQVRKRVAGVFESAEEFVEGLRPRLHGAVNELRQPVVTFVSTTVDSALEIRERGENLAASVQRDAEAMRTKAEGWVKKFIRA
jgi:hypothetical protein